MNQKHSKTGTMLKETKTYDMKILISKNMFKQDELSLAIVQDSLQIPRALTPVFNSPAHHHARRFWISIVRVPIYSPPASAQWVVRKECINVKVQAICMYQIKQIWLQIFKLCLVNLTILSTQYLTYAQISLDTVPDRIFSS